MIRIDKRVSDFDKKVNVLDLISCSSIPGTTTSTKSSRSFRTRGLCTSSEAERTTGGNRSWKGLERQGYLVRHRCDFEYVLLLEYIDLMPLFRVDGERHGGVENVYVCFSPAKNMR